MIVAPAMAKRAAVVAVADRSACAAVRVVTVSLLLARLGSAVTVVTLTVLVIVVPVGVVGSTWNTREKIAVEPAGIVAIYATSVLPGRPAPNAGPESCASETKIVLAGGKSVAPTSCASLGPAFASVIV